MQDEEHRCHNEQGCCDEMESAALGNDATNARQRGGSEHGGANLKTDSVGGKFAAKALRSSGHQTGEYHSEAEPTEQESCRSGGRQGIPREKRRPQEGGTETNADQLIDGNAINDEAEDYSASENAGPVDCDPGAGSLRRDSARFSEDGK